MKEILYVFLGLVVFCQLCMCGILLYHDGQKVYNQHQEDVQTDYDRELVVTAADILTVEEIDQLVEEALDPTTKAALSLKASVKRHAKLEQEKVDMTPRADCRGTWSNLSPAEQIKRVNEVLGTPNEPDKGLQ